MHLDETWRRLRRFVAWRDHPSSLASAVRSKPAASPNHSLPEPFSLAPRTGGAALSVILWDEYRRLRYPGMSARPRSP